MKTTTHSNQNHSCCDGSHENIPSAGSEAANVLKDGILDVRELSPARRHSLIFETFNQSRKRSIVRAGKRP
jgi:hypothetical protein